MGIPMSKPAHRLWTAKELKLIGTMPDHDLARKLGRHPRSVQSKRLALKIPYVKPRYVWWKPHELELLRTLPEEEVARRTGRTVRAVRLKKRKLRRRASVQ